VNRRPSASIESATNKNWIVVTTVNPPGRVVETILKRLSDTWRLVVVGDKKTRGDWSEPRLEFLSVDCQRERFGDFADQAPYNHYARKNFGYLYAISQGAERILETDDDTFFYPERIQGLGRTVRGRRVGGAEWSNVFSYFYDGVIWPRGLPLDAIREVGQVLEANSEADCPIQQFLIDDDPDVDAIHRLIFPGVARCREGATPVILDPDTCVPFNTQNTLFFADAFPLLYLPHFCSFRMTDIWRSFVAQVVLWRFGGRLAYQPATARQERNPHDLMRDFRDEVDGYLQNRAMVRELREAASRSHAGDMAGVALDLWRALVAKGYLPEKELPLVERWLGSFPATED
jgi:hypothetical protein